MLLLTCWSFLSTLFFIVVYNYDNEIISSPAQISHTPERSWYSSPIREYKKPIWAEMPHFRVGRKRGDCPEYWDDLTMNGEMVDDIACGCEITERMRRSNSLHPCCRKRLLHLFNTFNKEMSKLHVMYVLVDGALIGTLRDGKLVPYDRDLDFFVKLQDWESKPFNRVLQRLAFIHGMCVGHVEDFKLKICFKGMCADIWPTIVKKGYVYIDFHDWIAMPLDVMYPEQKTIFEGVDTFIPNKPKDYNDVRFGKGLWEKPLHDCDKNRICTISEDRSEEYERKRELYYESVLEKALRKKGRLNPQRELISRYQDFYRNMLKRIRIKK